MFDCKRDSLKRKVKNHFQYVIIIACNLHDLQSHFILLKSFVQIQYISSHLDKAISTN